MSRLPDPSARRARTRLHAAALALVATFAGPALAALPHAHDFAECVDHRFDFSAIAPDDKSAAKAVLSSDTVGNLTVIELQGDYHRGLTQPRVDVAQRVYQTHADAYDFLIVFSTFEFPTGDALAFYSGIRNDVEGIGQQVFDDSAYFGSAGRLQGYIDMAAVGRYDFNARNPAFATPLGTLSHELMHRWGVFADYREAGGGNSSALLGRDGAHWSLLADTGASVMYGARWEETAPGQFRIVDARQRFGAWDLYLAGFADAAEVPPMRLIRGSSLDPTALPIVGTETTGTADSIDIAQLIAAEGVRVPSAIHAQRHFKAGLVLLRRPGEAVDPMLLAQLERFRVAFESYFQSITDGRASIAIGHAGALTSTPIAAPVPLTGSAAPAPVAPLTSAVAWLQQRQQADGHWQDRPGTAVRDTAIAYAAIAQVAPQWPGLATARAWLDAQSTHTSDAAAWRTWASEGASAGDLALLSPQQHDGIGIQPGWQPATLDSALALRTHAERSMLGNDAAQRLGRFLRTVQREDGSFASNVVGPASVQASIGAARALLRATDPADAAAGAAARDWLVGRFDLAPGNASLHEAAELLYHAGALQLPAILRADLQSGLLARQGSAGEWSGSVYTTALSALGIALQSQPNYQLGAAAVTPAAPVLGEPLALSVRVRNSGGQPAPATTLQWYRNAAPGNGGIAVGAAFAVPPLLAGEVLTVDTAIESDTLAGVTSLVAAIDVVDAIVESNETDNEAALPIGIAPRPAGIDAALYATDVILAPTSFTSIGQRIDITGRVRNLGTVAAPSVRLALFRVVNGQRTLLVDTTLALPAATTTPFALQFDVANPGNHRLELVADPDNTVAEAVESNNMLALALPFGDAVDLVLDDADVAIEPAAPVFGDDVRIRATVRNPGTRASAATQIALERNNAGTWERLQALPLSVPAADWAMREFVWRPERDGEHVLRVVVDPDNLVVELDDTNNTVQRTITLGSGDQENLLVVPGSLQFDPDPPREGRALGVTATVRNVGNNATGGFNAGLYLGDPRVDGVRLAVTRVAGGVAGGADASVLFDVADFPVAGDATLFVFADSDLEISERSEADNIGIRETIALHLPDLDITQGAVTLDPPSPVIGAPVTASVVVSNTGEQASDAVLVRLFERAGQERNEIVPAATLPSLTPGASHTLDWTWTFGQSPGADALTVSVDPDNALREGDELNNEVTLAINAQSGDAFVTEPYFSPNGDGIRDRSTAFFVLPAAEIATVLVRDALDRPVADLAATLVRDGDRISATWDGRDTRGAIAPDGRYVLLARRNDGSIAANVNVVLDNNTPMALDAVNTDRAVLRNLPPSANPWHRAPNGSAADDYVYALGSTANASNATQRGVFRSHVLMGGQEIVLSSRWLDRHAQTNGLDTIEVEQLALGAVQGRVLLLMREHVSGGGQRVALWVQDANAVDNPRRIAELPGESWDTEILGSFDAERILVGHRGEYGESDRWIIDLAAPSITPLQQPDSSSAVLHVYPQGVVLGRGNDWDPRVPTHFVPADPAQSPVDLYLDAGSWDCMVRVQYQPNAPRILFHVQRGGQEWVDVVDLRTGDSRRLAEGVPYGGYCEQAQSRAANGRGKTAADKTGADKAAEGEGGNIEDGRDLAIFRAFWLEREDEIWVLDHAADSMRRFSPAGDALAPIALPPIGRVGDYAPTHMNYELPEVFPGEVVVPGWSCRGAAVPSWRSMAHGHGFERSMFDPAARAFYVARGDVVLGVDDYTGYQFQVCDGATAYRRVGLDAQATSIGGLTRWPLTTGADMDRFPLAQLDNNGDTVLPAAWPSFIHRNGTQLRRDGRVMLADGTLTRPWNQATRFLRAWPDDTRLQIGDRNEPAGRKAVGDSEGEQFSAVFSTLDRMSAVLRASSDGRGVRLSGMATDRNFDRFSIDYAHADAPDTWLTLMPGTREEVIFDDFMTWAPPAAGAYLFRLSVSDRAGNVQRRYASAEVRFGSPLVNLRQDHRAISPNGDGVQDTLGLTFTVVRETEQRFRVIDEASRVVFEQNLVYGTPELGPQSWRWDGRNGSGGVVPDGRYRVELSAGFQVMSLVDTIAPTLSGTQRPSYPPTNYAFDYCTDDVYGSRRSTTMTALAQRRVVGDAAWVDWTPLGHRCSPTETVPAVLSLRRAEHLQHQYRLVSTDTAGNRTVLEFAAPQPLFAMLSADGWTQSPMTWQPAPFVSTTAAAIPEHKLDQSPMQPLVSVLYPGPDVPLYFSSHLERFDDEVLIDLAVVPDEIDAALDWQTIASGVPQASEEHVYSLDMDLTLYQGRNVALRLRSHGADGTRESNAFLFQVGGVILGCVEPSREFQVFANLLHAQSDPRMEVTLPGSGNASIALSPTASVSGTYNYAVPGGVVLPSLARFSVKDGRNREVNGEFQLDWCPGGGGGGGGGGNGNPSWDVAPVVADACDATPTGQVRVNPRLLPGETRFRLNLHDPLQALPVIVAEGGAADVPATGFVVSTAGLPEGEARISFEAAADTGPWRVESRVFPVDRSAPQVALFEPSPGSRICPGVQRGVAVDGDVYTDTRMEFMVDIATPGSEVFTAVDCSFDADTNIFGRGVSCDRDPLESNHVHHRTLPASGQLGFLGADAFEQDQPLTFRLHAADWSGAHVCATSTVDVDFAARFEERSEPEPRVAGVANPQRVAVSTRADATLRVARWFFLAREPLHITGDLHHAERSGHGYHVVGDALQRAIDQDNVNGSFDPQWDATGQGLDDGLYAMVFTATDDCGNTRTITRYLTLDSTPPAFDVTRPLDGDALRAVSVEVFGAVADAHLDTWEIALAEGSNGPWMPAADGVSPVPVARVLAQWPTLGRTGPLWLRLLGVDQLGNRLEQVRALTLLERPPIMDAARTLPSLFSPNDDGTLDRSDIEIVLRRAASLQIAVRAGNGALVRTLETGLERQPGIVRVPWDGRNDAGVVVPDGEYVVTIAAQDLELPGSIDDAELTFTVDTTPPALTDIAPDAGGFATCDAAALFTVDDLHLQEYDATLARADGSTVATAAGRVAGTVDVAAFTELAEGEYRLTLHALDAAGNRAEDIRAFTLDCTAPDAAIATPLDGAVIARAPDRGTDITGRVTDAHLASYTLRAVPANDPQQAVLLAQGTDAVTDALLHRWTPTVADGDYALVLTARDRAGNETEALVSVIVDGTPPIADITSPDDGDAVQGWLELVGTASDDNFLEYRVEIASLRDAAAGLWSTAFIGDSGVDDQRLSAFELVQQGEVRVRVVAVDRAGFEASDEIGISVDSIPPPPPINLVARTEGGTNVRLNWQGGDAPDLAGFHVFRDDMPVSSDIVAQRTHLDVDVPEGLWSYTVIAVDHAGNASEPSNIATARVDRTGPDVAILQPGNGERVRGELEILGTAFSADDFADYELRLVHAGNDTLLHRGTAPVQAGLLHRLDTRAFAEDTPLRLRLVARDTSGNLSQAIADVVVDNLPPAAPTGLVATLQTPDVQVDWDPNTEPDLLGYLLYRNGSLVDFGGSLPVDMRPLSMPDNHYLDPSPPDGELSYRVYAIDLAGNISPPSAPANVVRDEDPPHVELVRPQDGLVFDDAIEVAADSDERDIVSVRFAYRAIGDAAWIDLGAAVVERPWRVPFDPQPLDYGTYELTAVAIDEGGRVDPEPHVIAVTYADLTPPAAPQQLRARADGTDVHATWQANTEDDLAGYHVERLEYDGQWNRLTGALLTTPAYTDTHRWHGDHVYRVIAVDTSDNASPASADSTAHVFEPHFHPLPHTPTSADDIDIDGVGGTHGGDAQLRVISPAGVRDLTPGPLPAQEVFTLPGIALDAGVNAFELRVLDSDGNRSIAATTRVTRGLVPAAPDNVGGSVNGGDVSLDWTASASADVAGYRVYRNGVVLLPDTTPVLPTQAIAWHGDVAAAIDGNLATAWRTPSDPGVDTLLVPLELQWDTPVLLGTVRLQWTDAAHSARSFLIEGWYDDRWNLLAHVPENASAERTVRLDPAYPTQRLRFVPMRAQAYGREHALAEISLFTRALVAGTSTADAPMDGRHVYEVASVSTLGFEGTRSAPWIADVGDADAPGAVVLSGELEGRDALLTWTASDAPDLSHYELRRNDVAVADVAAADPRSLRDAALPNGTQRYVVHAVDSVGNVGPASNTVEFTLDGDVPGKPTIVRVASVGGQPALQVDWMAGGGSTAVAWRLFHSHDRDGIDDPYRELVRQPGTRYVHTGLTYGERVYYRVQGEDANGNIGELSDPVLGEVRNISTPSAPRITAPTVPERPISLAVSQYDVCGMAEPDTRVFVSVNGTAAGEPARSVAGDAIHRIATNEYKYGVALSPDGRMLVQTYSDRAFIRNLDGGSDQAFNDFYGGWRELSFSPAGDVLYGIDWNGALREWYVGEEWTQGVWIDVSSVSHYALSPTDDRMLVAGYRDNTSGLWLARRDGSPSQPIDVPNANQFWRLLWSSDGNHAYAHRSDGSVFRIDTTTLAVTQLVNGLASSAEIDVSPLDETLLYLRSESGGISLYTRGLDGTSTLLAQRGADAIGAAWSPDGRQIALLFEQRIELIDAADGTLVRSTPLNTDTLWSAYRLRWTPSWKLMIGIQDNYMQTLVIDPAGRFCVRNVPAQTGLNIVDAVSERDSGVRSQRSLPIEIDIQSGGVDLPDLAIQSSDIRFLPAAGEPGREYGAVVTVRMRGNSWLPRVQGRATLIAPDGTRTPQPAFDDLGSLGDGAQSYTLRLGTLPQTGEYRLQIELDPGGLIAERDELNNIAASSLYLAATGSAELMVAADSATAAPGGIFTGDVQVAGATGFVGSVRLRITDAEGNLVNELMQEAVGPLAFGAPWQRRWTWVPALGSLASSYLLDAQLLDGDGGLVQAQTVPLRIEAQHDVRLHLQPARTSAQIGDSVALQFGLDYASGNEVLSGGQLRVVAIDAAGTESPVWQGPTGALLPGYVIRRSSVWRTLAAAPGTARLRLEFTAAGLAQQIEREVQLTQAPPAVLLSGALSVAPSTRLVLGETGGLDYRVTNAGSGALANVEARVALRLEGATDVLLSDTLDGPLAAGAALQGTLALDTLPQRPQSYVATLEARAAGGDWSLLAQLGLSSVDALAPEIVVLSPAPLRPHRIPALLASDIVDRHARVATAQYSVDGSEWRNLRAQGSRHESPLTGLADGEHRITIRAVDTWGNERISAPHPFVADSTPPQIHIVGVIDGQLGNVPVVPVVTVTDAHPEQLSVWLDGQPFTSGDTVAADGVHTLTVLAIDAAGNRSDARLTFTLDATPPPVAIVDPIDNAQVLDASIPVRVETEALASVTLQRGPWQAERAADGNGVVVFPDVPLAIGNNTLVAVARDAATNASAPVQITVRRQGAGDLTGSVLPAAASIARGAVLDATLTLDNGTADVITALPLRVRVLGAGGAELGAWTGSATLAAGATWLQPVDFATTTWPLGPVALEFAATLDGVWQVLDTAGVTLVDGSAPQLTPLAPAQGLLTRSPVALAANASDDDVLAGVSALLDGATTVALALDAGSGEWRASAMLADGAHTVQFRADDATGNVTTSTQTAFVVDNTPPQIVVSGTTDGGLYGTPVQAQVTVLDAHPQTLTITLNGAAYTSGTPITASGVYTLIASAVDGVGLTDERSLVFEVDLSVPTVSIAVPSDGAIVTGATTPVSGLASPFATVLVSGETSTHSATADAAGGYAVDGVDLIDGENRITAVATDRLGRISPEAAVTVFRSAGNADGISGSLAATPVQLPAGDELELAWAVAEEAGLARNDLALRLSVRRAGSADVLHTQGFVVDLAADGTLADVATVASTGWPLGGYVAVFEAQLDGTWDTLATASFSVVDRDGPTLGFVAPAADSYHATQAAVAVQASDALGNVARVELRINGGGWIALVPAAPRGAAGAWTGMAPSPGDGPATLNARAFDDAGNASAIATRGIVFDATPPLIVINGVTDGELRNTAATPQVTVTDASPLQTVVTLDGAPYVPGTPITSDGSHVLAVRSTDAAGNSAERSVAFAIDTTAPVATIASPADGTVLRSAQVDVLGHSEADVAIELRIGSTTLPTRTDAGGSFAVPRVALAPGANRIAARATDRAGNVGAWSEIAVERRGQGVLRGTLQAPGTLTQGRNLGIGVNLANDADEAIAPSPVRVVATLSDGRDVVIDSRNIDLVARGNANYALRADTGTWPAGNVTLRLFATLDGELQLASATLQLEAGNGTPPPAPQPTVIPVDGAWWLFALVLLIVAFAASRRPLRREPRA